MRTSLLKGVLPFPEKVDTLLTTKHINEDTIFGKHKDLLDTIWYNYLKGNSTNTITAMGKFNDLPTFNAVLIYLSTVGYITSTIEQNYAYITLNEEVLLKHVSRQELDTLRYRFRLKKYTLTSDKNLIDNCVKINHTVKKTGLIRKGFAKASTNEFSYDGEYLTKYYVGIVHNVVKGLKTSVKDITYEDIVADLGVIYSRTEEKYTLGKVTMDSRGRAIFDCTHKVLNPITSKEARALLICPEEILTIDGVNRVYAFIAELLDFSGYYEEKIKLGIQAYKDRSFGDLNYKSMLKKEDFKDLYILIWLERIYEALQSKRLYWDIPIELDATASMIQIIGALTNDHNYLDKTNVISEEYSDIWTIEGVPRDGVKKAMQPKLYGSSASTTELWDKNKIPYTQKQLNIISKTLEKGGIFYNANNFKDFIIKNVALKEEMTVKIWNDTFIIYCNKFNWSVTTPVTYSIYTTAQRICKPIIKEVALVPDLEQYKRYFVTLLIHNLDSQIANSVCMKLNGWVLPNHDSFTMHPNSAKEVCVHYTDRLSNIYQCRKQILSEFFTSTGITTEYKEMSNKQIGEFTPNMLK